MLKAYNISQEEELFKTLWGEYLSDDSIIFVPVQDVFFWCHKRHWRWTHLYKRGIKFDVRGAEADLGMVQHLPLNRGPQRGGTTRHIMPDSSATFSPWGLCTRTAKSEPYHRLINQAVGRLSSSWVLVKLDPKLYKDSEFRRAASEVSSEIAYICSTEFMVSFYCSRKRRQHIAFGIVEVFFLFLCEHDNSWTAALSLMKSRTNKFTANL